MISRTKLPLTAALAEATKGTCDWGTQQCAEYTAKQLIESGGTKFDSQKNRLDLLDWEALEGLGAVLTFGAAKYHAHNWRAGIQNSRIVAAMLRHLSAIQRGELIDPESGQGHIDHIGCCWMFLSNNLKNRPDLNDLFHYRNTAKPGVDIPDPT